MSLVIMRPVNMVAKEVKFCPVITALHRLEDRESEDREQMNHKK